MHVIALGMNHKTAPVAVRERLALTERTQEAVLAALTAAEPVQESVIVSTCNRLEVYAVVTRYHEAMEALVKLLSEHSGLPLNDLLPHLYFHHHHEVARHLFRVSCGLDSMVIGEDEILGQVREAYRSAEKNGCVGRLLHELFQRALRVGKRARAQTAIGEHAASVSYAAVELARQQLGSLAGRSVMVVGAGAMAERAADTLRRHGTAPVTFVNRTLEHAEALAQRWQGEALALDRLPDMLTQVDIAIFSTAAPHHLLSAGDLRAAMAQRGGRPLLVIDIAVPRNVDPEAASVPGVTLFDIDGLQQIIAENLRQREAEVPAVEALIRQEVASFSQWLEQQEIAPLIRSLRQKAEEIRQEELAKLKQKLPELNRRQWALIETATAVIVNKILTTPTQRLKQAAGDDQAVVYARTLSELFDLRDVINERLTPGLPEGLPAFIPDDPAQVSGPTEQVR